MNGSFSTVTPFLTRPTRDRSDLGPDSTPLRGLPLTKGVGSGQTGSVLMTLLTLVTLTKQPTNISQITTYPTTEDRMFTSVFLVSCLIDKFYQQQRY